MMKRRTRTFAFAVVGAVVALGVAACGGSSNNGASPAPSLTGKPIKIMSIVPTDTQVQNFPEILAAAKASVRAINAKGGINGRPLELIYCNEKQNAVAGEQCARDAVARGVVAFVGFSAPRAEAKIFDIAKAANIPVIAGRGVTDVANTNPMSFNIDAGNLAGLPLCPRALKDANGTKHTIVRLDIDQLKGLLPLVDAGVKGAGLTPTGVVVTIPGNATDYSTVVKQIQDSGADVVTTIITEGQLTQLLKTESDLGATFKVCTLDTVVSSKSEIALGDAAKNLYAVGSIPLDADNADVKQFLKDMAAEAATGDADAKRENLKPTAYRGWVGPQIVVQVAKSITGDITAASLIKTLQSSSDINAYMFGHVDFSKPGALGSAPSVRNFHQYLMHWNPQKQKFDLVEPGPVDALPYLLPGSR